MSKLLLPCAVLAQAGPLENIAREFQQRQTRVESGYLTAGLLILASVVMAVWILSKVFKRYGGGVLDSSSLLFVRLCRAHRLRWSERWLLWRVARDQQLKDPARLFLEPERLDPANLGSTMGHRRADLGAIRERLFAGLGTDSRTVSTG